VRFLLWGWLLFIYATVPVARDLLRLKESGLLPYVDRALEVLLVLGALGAILLLLSHGARAVPFVLFVIFLVWWAWRLPYPEEKVHLFEYAVLGFLAARCFRSPWKAMLFVFLAGVGDEVFQYFLPERVFDLRDIFLNTVSGGGGVWFGSFSSFSWPPFRSRPKS